VLARRRNVDLTVEQLEAPEPDEPREQAAAAYSIEMLADELTHVRRSAQHWEQVSKQLSTRASDLERALDTVYTSKSWRITRADARGRTAGPWAMIAPHANKPVSPLGAYGAVDVSRQRPRVRRPVGDGAAGRGSGAC
jgi:hypothetical protein